MNVSIINQQGHNFGDEAAGVALINELICCDDVKKINVFYASDAKIPVAHSKVVHYTDITLRNIGILNLVLFFIYFGKINTKEKADKLRNQYLRKLCKELIASNLVFVSPCGASIGIYKDWKYIVRLLIAIKCEKTPIFHYNTIGKSGNVLFDFIAYYILKKSDVYVREKRSADYLKTINLKTEVGPDTAFLLPDLESKYLKRENIVSFVPAHLDDWHPNFKKNNIDEFIETQIVKVIAIWIKENNLKLNIIPHFDLDTEITYCNKIKNLFWAENLAKTQVTVCNNIVNYERYYEHLSKSKYVIGMRYHAIVLAAKSATPFLALSYENKMKEVSSYTKQSEFCIELSSLNQEEIIRETKKRLSELVMKSDDIHNQLIAVDSELQNNARKIVNKYCRRIG